MDLKTFQCYTAEAPDLLEQIAQLLQECREKEILLPKGIRNLCALSWEELSDIPADAKPFHQTRVSGRPPRPYPTQVALTPDTRYRMSIVTSQILLPTESSLSVRQPNARFSTLKFKKKFPVDRDNNSEKQICKSHKAKHFRLQYISVLKQCKYHVALSREMAKGL